MMKKLIIAYFFLISLCYSEEIFTETLIKKGSLKGWILYRDSSMATTWEISIPPNWYASSGEDAAEITLRYGHYQTYGKEHLPPIANIIIKSFKKDNLKKFWRIKPNQEFNFKVFQERLIGKRCLKDGQEVEIDGSFMPDFKYPQRSILCNLYSLKLYQFVKLPENVFLSIRVKEENDQNAPYVKGAKKNYEIKNWHHYETLKKILSTFKIIPDNKK